VPRTMRRRPPRLQVAAARQAMQRRQLPRSTRPRPRRPGAKGGGRQCPQTCAAASAAWARCRPGAERRTMRPFPHSTRASRPSVFPRRQSSMATGLIPTAAVPPAALAWAARPKMLSFTTLRERTFLEVSRTASVLDRAFLPGSSMDIGQRAAPTAHRPCPLPPRRRERPVAWARKAAPAALPGGPAARARAAALRIRRWQASHHPMEKACHAARRKHRDARRSGRDKACCRAVVDTEIAAVWRARRVPRPT